MFRKWEFIENQQEREEEKVKNYTISYSVPTKANIVLSVMEKTLVITWWKVQVINLIKNGRFIEFLIVAGDLICRVKRQTKSLINF